VGVGGREPLCHRAAHGMTHEDHARTKMLDHAAHVVQVPLRTVVGRIRPLAPSMPAKIQGDYAPVRHKQGRDRVPPMTVRGAAVQQKKSVLARVSAPVQVVKLDALDFSEPADRLRPCDSRLLMRHRGYPMRGRYPSIDWHRAGSGMRCMVTPIKNRPRAIT